ncbi:MAG TPA: hypothetical protein VM620_13500 [Hyphomicrobium sp.]|jgi:hypothetical protein|nr:hypothetical protein [Hyphomicrobium sp.]
MLSLTQSVFDLLDYMGREQQLRQNTAESFGKPAIFRERRRVRVQKLTTLHAASRLMKEGGVPVALLPAFLVLTRGQTLTMDLLLFPRATRRIYYALVF